MIIQDWERDVRESTVWTSCAHDVERLRKQHEEDVNDPPELESVEDASGPTPSLTSVMGLGSSSLMVRSLCNK